MNVREILFQYESSMIQRHTKQTRIEWKTEQMANARGGEWCPPANISEPLIALFKWGLLKHGLRAYVILFSNAELSPEVPRVRVCGARSVQQRGLILLNGDDGKRYQMLFSASCPVNFGRHVVALCWSMPCLLLLIPHAFFCYAHNFPFILRLSCSSCHVPLHGKMRTFFSLWFLWAREALLFVFELAYGFCPRVVRRRLHLHLIC